MKITSAVYLRSAIERTDYPPGRMVEVAFAGRSNVGKSSMINTLLGRRSLVKTSKTPGHTRKLNFFLINDSFLFVDFPGYGFAKVPLKVRDSWSGMIDKYISVREQLAGVVSIIDSRHFPNELDQQLMDYLRLKKIPLIIAATKADKLNKSQLSQLIKKVKEFFHEEYPVVAFSSLTGFGKNELWKEIRWLMSKHVNK